MTESEQRVIAAARAWRDAERRYQQWRANDPSPILAFESLQAASVDLLFWIDALDREEQQQQSELDLLRSELAERIAYAEGVDEHVSDMLDAMRPFAEALKAGDPISKISFDNWKTLQKAYSHASQCLRPTPTDCERDVCECGHHRTDHNPECRCCLCLVYEQKGSQ